MTDAELAKHLSLMKAIPRETVHLPIATVERLMATGHKVSVGKVEAKSLAKGKIKPVVKQSASQRVGRMAKANREQESWLTAAQRQKDFMAGTAAYSRGKDITDCPHDGRTSAGMLWRSGWKDARANADKARRAK